MTLVAGVPPKVTPAPVRFEPVITNGVPPAAGPVTGVMAVTVGGAGAT